MDSIPVEISLDGTIGHRNIPACCGMEESRSPAPVVSPAGIASGSALQCADGKIHARTRGLFYGLTGRRTEQDDRFGQGSRAGDSAGYGAGAGRETALTIRLGAADRLAGRAPQPGSCCQRYGNTRPGAGKGERFVTPTMIATSLREKSGFCKRQARPRSNFYRRMVRADVFRDLLSKGYRRYFDEPVDQGSESE